MTPQSRPLRAGAVIGDWKLVEKIGEGGNGDVWEVVRTQGQTEGKAMKVLRPSAGRERIARFRREISFLATASVDTGILPLIESNLDGPPLWYVMPKATLMRDALGEDPPPSDVVNAFVDLTETAARLAAHGVAHRDIKPDNLFLWGSSWVLGDFGLVVYPEADRFTRHGRKAGPLEYMAPEMRRAPDTSDPHAADVYSILKSLWVVMSGRLEPLPGPYRANDEMCTLAGLDFPYTRELDELIEAGTSNVPGRRPTMETVAKELRRMSEPPPEKASSPEVADLAARIRALTSEDRERQQEVDRQSNKIAIAIHYLDDNLVNPVANELIQLVLPRVSRSDNFPAALDVVDDWMQCVRTDHLGWGLTMEQAEQPTIRVGASLCVYDLDTLDCKVAVVLGLTGGLIEGNLNYFSFREVARVRVGSVDFERTVIELSNRVRASYGDLLATYAQRLT